MDPKTQGRDVTSKLLERLDAMPTDVVRLESIAHDLVLDERPGVICARELVEFAFLHGHFPIDMVRAGPRRGRERLDVDALLRQVAEWIVDGNPRQVRAPVLPPGASNVVALKRP